MLVLAKFVNLFCVRARALASNFRVARSFRMLENFPRFDFRSRGRYDSGNAPDFKKPLKTFPKPAHTDIPAYLSVQYEGVLLAVKLQPRAAKNEIGAALGDELKIKVTAPPVDAAANQELVEFLAAKLDPAFLIGVWRVPSPRRDSSAWFPARRWPRFSFDGCKTAMPTAGCARRLNNFRCPARREKFWRIISFPAASPSTPISNSRRCLAWSPARIIWC